MTTSRERLWCLVRLIVKDEWTAAMNDWRVPTPDHRPAFDALVDEIESDMRTKTLRDELDAHPRDPIPPEHNNYRDTSQGW